MDPLTHTLFGAALADTGLRRRTALGTATLLIGANLPDLDAAAHFHSRDLALSFRRGWTHGVLAMMVLPVALMLAMLAVDRLCRRRSARVVPARSAELLGLAVIGVWSHPLLDFLNTYGIRLLMPFDGTWYYGNTLFIVDPWLWLLLGGILFLRHSRSSRSRRGWAALTFLTSAAVVLGSGSLNWAPVVWVAGVAAFIVLRMMLPVPGERWVRGALAAAAAYIAVMGLGTLAADRVAHAALAADRDFERLMISPVLLDPFHRSVVVERHDDLRFGHVRFFPAPGLAMDDPVIPKRGFGRRAAVIEAARRAPCVRGLVQWARVPFYEVDTDDSDDTDDPDDPDESDDSKHGGGYVVYILDARYVRSRTRGFGGAAVRVGRDLAPDCETEIVER